MTEKSLMYLLVKSYVLERSGASGMQLMALTTGIDELYRLNLKAPDMF